MKKYLYGFFSDLWKVVASEFKHIVCDGGVLIIFFVAGLGYPLLYNYVYQNGVLEDTPIAVVDDASCPQSREFIRALDATREVRIAARCADMQQAREMMASRKVNGIVLFPSDFGQKLASMQTATISVYADMSSFLYYKNLLMGSEFVMLSQMGDIQVERYSEAGLSPEQTLQLTKAIPYVENVPYNKTFSYSVFLISAILMLIVQQVMFYGMTMLAGTMREEHDGFALLSSEMTMNGTGRIIFGRMIVYWLIFMGLGIYIGCIVPSIFGLPQRGSYWQIVCMLCLYVLDVTFFCMAWSTFFKRRESVFVMLLFFSPICVFLTGFSWPEAAFPTVWRLFSYVFPSTFGCRAFINMSTAGGSLAANSHLISAMTLQTIVYFILAYIDLMWEKHFRSH